MATPVEYANRMFKIKVTPSERIRKSNVACAGFCTEGNRVLIPFTEETSQAYKMVNRSHIPATRAMSQLIIPSINGFFRGRGAVFSVSTSGCSGSGWSAEFRMFVEISSLGGGGDAGATGIEPCPDSGAVEIWSTEGGLFTSLEGTSGECDAETTQASICTALPPSVIGTGPMGFAEYSAAAASAIRSGGASLEDFWLGICSEARDIGESQLDLKKW